MVALNSTLRFPVVLFDLGSTLIYFSGNWPEVMQQGQKALVQTLLHAGLKLDATPFTTELRATLDQYFSSRDDELIEHTTSVILQDLLSKRGCSSIPDFLLQNALQAMYQVSEACWHVETETHQGLSELRSQGYRLGLISNAADDANVQRLVDKAALRPYFDVILTSAALGIRKPHPRIFYAALETWQVVPAQAVMVGDTLSADIQGAKKLGIFSVWVTRRAVHADDLPADSWPDAIVENVGELPDFLSSQ